MTKIKPEAAAVRLQRLLERDKLTADQQSALQDALLDVENDLQVNSNLPEIAAFTLKLALEQRDPDDEAIVNLLDIMRRVQSGEKFRGYRAKKKQRDVEFEQREAEKAKAIAISSSRSDFMLRVVRQLIDRAAIGSRYAKSVVPDGILSGTILIFERVTPETKFNDKDIVLCKGEGERDDEATRGRIYERRGTFRKDDVIVGRAVGVASISPCWQYSGKDEPSYARAISLEMREIYFKDSLIA